MADKRSRHSGRRLSRWEPRHYQEVWSAGTLETGPNRGGNVARNRLLELAQGEWLQYLDADDYLLPQKIENQARCVEGQSNTDVVYGPVLLEHVVQDKPRRELLPIAEPHDPWVLLARWYLPQTGSCLWRKQAILDAGSWKVDQPCCQEHELYLRMLKAGKQFTYCAANGAVYRQWTEMTVCKRDPREVRHRRLEIEQWLEDFLRQRNELTAARRWAINQARFEMARMAWQNDRDEALEIIRGVYHSQHNFIPRGDAARGAYRIIYRVFGFRLAEIIADRCRNRRLFNIGARLTNA